MRKENVIEKEPFKTADGTKYNGDFGIPVVNKTTTSASEKISGAIGVIVIILLFVAFCGIVLPLIVN